MDKTMAEAVYFKVEAIDMRSPFSLRQRQGASRLGQAPIPGVFGIAAQDSV
jgi:hypothetical protein